MGSLQIICHSFIFLLHEIIFFSEDFQNILACDILAFPTGKMYNFFANDVTNILWSGINKITYFCRSFGTKKTTVDIHWTLLVITYILYMTRCPGEVSVSCLANFIRHDWLQHSEHVYIKYRSWSSVSCWLHIFCNQQEGWSSFKRFDHNSRGTVVTLT